MLLEEFSDYLRPENIRHSSFIFVPLLNIVIWVCPKDIAHYPSVTYLKRTFHSLNLLETSEIR